MFPTYEELIACVVLVLIIAYLFYRIGKESEKQKEQSCPYKDDPDVTEAYPCGYMKDPRNCPEFDPIICMYFNEWSNVYKE